MGKENSFCKVTQRRTKSRNAAPSRLSRVMHSVHDQGSCSILMVCAESRQPIFSESTSRFLDVNAEFFTALHARCNGAQSLGSSALQLPCGPKANLNLRLTISAWFFASSDTNEPRRHGREADSASPTRTTAFSAVTLCSWATVAQCTPRLVAGCTGRYFITSSRGLLAMISP